MHVRYRIRRTEGGVFMLETSTGEKIDSTTSPSMADRWLHELAAGSGLTVYHRDVFSRVQQDGSHEVLAIAASMHPQA